jgi:hypothetical protein
MRDCARRLTTAGAVLAGAGAASWGPLAVAAVIVTSPCCC